MNEQSKYSERDFFEKFFIPFMMKIQTKYVILLAHNGNRFDHKILYYHLVSIPSYHILLKRKTITVIDTLPLFRQKLVLKSYSMEAIYLELFNSNFPNSHSSKGDTMYKIDELYKNIIKLCKVSDEKRIWVYIQKSECSLTSKRKLVSSSNNSGINFLQQSLLKKRKISSYIRNA